MFGFIRRTIGAATAFCKAERVPAVDAHVFREASTLREELNEMAGNDADCRMPDPAPDQRFLQEGVPAETRIFQEAVARRDVTRAMTEQAAQVAHLFLERRRRRVGIVLRIEQQRMTALRAHVFMAPVAIGELLVIVLAEKARQRVPHARQRSIFRKIFGPAAALPPGIRLLENMIVDVMSPQEAR
jgi:hypothetical protein